MENTTQTTIVHLGFIGIIKENRMETTIVCLCNPSVFLDLSLCPVQLIREVALRQEEGCLGQQTALKHRVYWSKSPDRMPKLLNG